jgi:hypothetical protein
MLVADTVMYAIQPGFQIGKDEMDNWQILFGHLRIAPFSDGQVFVSTLGEAGVAAPVVGNERCPWYNGTLNEPAE